MRILKSILSITTVSGIVYLLSISCSSSSTVNDFFGIKMDIPDTALFKIESYSEADGIKYYSSPLMDPKISAWGEITPNMIQFHISNNSPYAIKSSHGMDQYSIETNEGKVYILDKGKFFGYPMKGSIQPNASATLWLELPTDFHETIGMTKPDGDAENYTFDFWKGMNKTNIAKDNIKLITIKLGGETTIILKPVP